MKTIKETIFLEDSELEEFGLDGNNISVYPIYITEDDEILLPWNGLWLPIQEITEIMKYQVDNLRAYLGLGYIEEGF